MSKKQFIFRFIKRIRDSEITNTGAMLSYFILFSLFPFLIVLLNLVSFITSGYEVKVLEFIQMLPATISETLTPYIHGVINSSSTGLFSFSLVISIWSSSLGMGKIIQKVGQAFDSETTNTYLITKLWAILLSLALLVLILIVLSLGPLASLAESIIVDHIKHTALITLLIKLAKALLPLVFMIIVFTLIYKVSLREDDISMRDILPGSIFTTVAWSIITAIFTIYLKFFSNYDKTYGSMAGIIALLTWLFLSGITIIVGACFAATLKEYRDIRDEGGRIKIIN